MNARRISGLNVAREGGCHGGRIALFALTLMQPLYVHYICRMLGSILFMPSTKEAFTAWLFQQELFGSHIMSLYIVGALYTCWRYTLNEDISNKPVYVSHVTHTYLSSWTTTVNLTHPLKSLSYFMYSMQPLYVHYICRMLGSILFMPSTKEAFTAWLFQQELFGSHIMSLYTAGALYTCWRYTLNEDLSNKPVCASHVTRTYLPSWTTTVNLTHPLESPSYSMFGVPNAHRSH